MPSGVLRIACSVGKMEDIYSLEIPQDPRVRIALGELAGFVAGEQQLLERPA